MKNKAFKDVLILVFGEDMRIVTLKATKENVYFVLILVFGEDMRIEEILQKIILQYIKYKKIDKYPIFWIEYCTF